MRGPRNYRPDVPTKKKKCSEHVGTDCTDCCSVTACAYCLELEIYGQAILYGYAPESAKHWIGTVGVYSFDAYWERNYETDVCEFVVMFDGTEVYRQPCGYISCRDSSDEVGVTIGYDEGTLRWRKHEPRPLEHVTDYETGCKSRFCGTCECSCDCLCVTIVDGYTRVAYVGEICDVSYPCDGPVWAGSIGPYALSLALDQDIYGNCVIVPTVDGVERNAVSASGCGAMTAEIVLYDGTTISVRCKVCSCDALPGCCPPGTCNPSVFLTVTSSGAKCVCLVGTTFELFQEPGCNQTWHTLNATAPTCDDVALMQVSMTVTCVTVNGEQQWMLTVHNWDRCTLVGVNPPAGGCTPASDACTISLNGACPPSATFCFTFSGLDCCNVMNGGEQVCFELSI